MLLWLMILLPIGMWRAIRCRKMTAVLLILIANPFS